MEQELFNYNDRIIVTSNALRNGAQLFPIRTIAKVSDFMMPMAVKDFIINLVIFIVGLVVFFSFTVLGMILGLIMLVICGRNCYDILTRKHYMVVVHFNSGEKQDFDFSELNTAINFRDALHYALTNS